ncbi:uncharacterized protein CTHT_0032710 [Thermochaetoides thermophila DSM 1495]|uniref:Uncharacterized protein n=1 Tax=Chaetomium thermophilum (strain DSM 1495 / CBS 144.50 / IMI 039719) TaxID=759272 RepID=G0S594_CHATD|nr:hypothetical protein CTHT_0032710 [Thermochaetoides thermophila DSM 1495]EGS21413.1 hypothetical protein CTHT_0032710 [Thermochaetoides thermophila DSM 1495]
MRLDSLALGTTGLWGSPAEDSGSGSAGVKVEVLDGVGVAAQAAARGAQAPVNSESDAAEEVDDKDDQGSQGDQGQGSVSDRALRPNNASFHQEKLPTRTTKTAATGASKASRQPRQPSRNQNEVNPSQKASRGAGSGKRAPPRLTPWSLPQNADIPPPAVVFFPGGKNPYLDRPLPAPPSGVGSSVGIAGSTLPLTSSSSSLSSTSTSISSSIVTKPTNNTPKPDDISTPDASHTIPTTTSTMPLTSNPSRSRTVLPERPSTSHGPGSSRSGSSSSFGSNRSNHLNNKRISRDDMALMGLTRPNAPFMSGSSGKPTGMLTPELSPQRTTTVTRTFSPAPMVARVQTPESVTSGEIPIGMALGSPARDAPIWTGSGLGSLNGSSTLLPHQGWKGQTETVITSGYSPSKEKEREKGRLLRTPTPDGGKQSEQTQQQQQSQSQGLQRNKTQKRKLFSGWFGRKGEKEKKEQEIDKQSDPLKSNAIIESRPPARSNTIVSRSNTISSRKAPKHKPIIISKPEPQMLAPDPASTLREPPRLVPQRSFEDRWPTPSTTTTSTGGLFLDVEIPDVRLERYSVMFSGVLNRDKSSQESQQQSQQQEQQQQPSLLERRQIALEKLKRIETRIVMEEEMKARMRERRATSPQPMKSPAFVLFPPSPTAKGNTDSMGGSMPGGLAPPPQKGLKRSNTSPALLSPSRANFENNEHNGEEKRKRNIPQASPRTMERAEWLERIREQQMQAERQAMHARTKSQSTTASNASRAPTTVYFYPNESSLILDSSDSDTGSESETEKASDDETDQIASTTLRPTPPTAATAGRTTPVPNMSRKLPFYPPPPPEPQWQMVTPPSMSGLGSTTSPSSSSSSSSPESTTTTATTISPGSQKPNDKPGRERSLSPSSSTSPLTTTPPSPGTMAIPMAITTDIPVPAPTTLSRNPSNTNLNLVHKPSVSTLNNGRKPSLDLDGDLSDSDPLLNPSTRDPRISVDEEDAALKAAVEISIARQISISRQQRKLLPVLRQVNGPPAGSKRILLGEGTIKRSATVAGSGTARSKMPQVPPGPQRRGSEGDEKGKGNESWDEGGDEGDGKEEITIGVIKGRSTPVTVLAPPPGMDVRRSERVVLDVA